MYRQAQDLVPPEVHRSYDQLASMWKVIVADRGGDDLRCLPGMTIRWAESQFPFWNTLILSEEISTRERGEEILAQASSYMRGKRQPGLMWVCEEYLAPSIRRELTDIIAAAGLSYSLTCHGMEGEFFPMPEPSHPALTFVRANIEQLALAYGEINARAYSWGPEIGHAGLRQSPLWKEQMQAWLGVENGVPVSAAAAIPNDESLFVALVATSPSAQRKGYGEATTRKALYEAAKTSRLKRAVLHATDAGMPVYSRIGFRKVSTFHCYGLT